MVSYPGAYGGEVGRMAGFSRRERYFVPGTAPLGKRNVVSHRLAVRGELVLEITVLEMLPDKRKAWEKSGLFEGFREQLVIIKRKIIGPLVDLGDILGKMRRMKNGCKNTCDMPVSGPYGFWPPVMGCLQAAISHKIQIRVSGDFFLMFLKI